MSSIANRFWNKAFFGRWGSNLYEKENHFQTNAAGFICPTYLLGKDEKVSKKFRNHNLIEIRYYWLVYFSIWQKFYWTSVYFIDNLEDNHKIVRDRFITDLVNVMKNIQLVAKKHKEISIYVNLTQSHQRTIAIFTRNSNTQNFRNFVRNCW